MFLNRHRLLIAAGVVLISSAASAMVIRHDVPDARYRVDASAFLPLADMPGVGHGVLITPEWVVTVAHAVQPDAKHVVIAERPRAVAKVIYHPGYRSMPQEMVQRAMAANDAAEVVKFLRGNHDIALVKLAQPVADVVPAAIYRGSSELGREVQMLGKGATGDGLTGVPPGSPHRGTLRRGFNRIATADGRWISYVFDRGADAHRLEGMSGSGDSGGPLLIREGGRWQVAGLTSWQDGNLDLAVPPSRYGQITVGVRLSHYADWIDGVLREQPANPQ